MELREYIRAVRRRWRWILVPVLLTVAFTAGLAATAAPVHRSSVVLFVTTAEPDDADLRTSRLNSYVALLTGPRVADAVVAELRLPLRGREVQEKITAEVQPGTDLLVVTATDRSPERSRAIVTSATGALATLAQQLEPPRAGTPGPSVAVTVAQQAVTVRQPRGLLRDLGYAAVLGLLIGAAAVALRETLRRTADEERDLQRLGLDTVGVISLDGRSGRHGGAAYPDEALAEAFRRLRTVLPAHAQGAALGGRSLLLTSSIPDEGTTAVACGLAIATAEAGFSVVLVDANLRTPGVGRYLALDTTRGLADVLSGSAALPAVLQHSTDGRLTVLPAGFHRTDPGELLAAPALGDTIARLKNRFDTVLIDAPPLRAVADAAVLSKVTDGVLLVVRAGDTRTADVERSVDLLRRAGAHLVGAVLNALPRRLPGTASWGQTDPPEPSVRATSPEGWQATPIVRVGPPRPDARPGTADATPGRAPAEPGPAATGRARVVPVIPTQGPAGRVAGRPARQPDRVVDLSLRARGQARVVSITDAGEPVQPLTTLSRGERHDEPAHEEPAHEEPARDEPADRRRRPGPPTQRDPGAGHRPGE